MHRRFIVAPAIAMTVLLSGAVPAVGGDDVAAQKSAASQSTPQAKDTIRWRGHTKRYERTGLVAFPQLAICINYEMSGTYRYQKGKVRMPITNEVQYYIRGRLAEPTMRVWSTRYSDVSHVCTSRHLRWQKLLATQNFARPPCKRDFEFSVSVPWGVGAAVSPSCTKQERMRRTSDWDTPAWTRTQFNSRKKIRFEREMPFVKYVGQPQPRKSATCLDLFPRFHVYTRNGDDIKLGQRHRVCLGGRY